MSRGDDERPLPALRVGLAVVALLERLRPQGPRTLAEQRSSEERALLSMRYVTRTGRGALAVEDHAVPVDGTTVRVRRYRPSGASGALPTHVIVHGGAYWAGSVEAYDPLCSFYARALRCQVVSVDYRLAPEHPYPTGVEDCYAALVWVADHAGTLGVDLARLSLGGVSAGGGLAAAVALLARDRRGPALCLQLLEIPMLDPSTGSRSLDTYAHGYHLTRDDVVAGWERYLPDGVPTLASGRPDPYAGAFAADDLTGLPPAAVLTAGCDPLRDEGEAYVARLREAGVPVATYRASGHVHASHYLTRFLPSARRAVAWTTDALRRAYAEV